MADPLRTDIQRALRERLNPDLFEECAADVLRDEWPSLVPIPGGDDDGLDGLSVTSDETPVGLVSTTTKDAIGNLTRSLERHMDVGGVVRRVIFATPRTLSTQQVRNLKQRATEFGCDLLQVYQQQAFVDRLYQSPQWLKHLLGLSGAPSALSEYPRLWRPSAEIPLIGRQADIDSLAASSTDLVLEGQAGVGKTYILQELVRAGWGLFLVDDDRERLAAALRSLQPQRVIVDDAHFAMEQLAGLLQLRKAVTGDFAIVATTWPGRREEVERMFDVAATASLEPLPRDEILRVIEEVGVKEPTNLQRRIVDQAMGRPGLAATLARLCVRGSVSEVASGQALMIDTLTTCRRTIGERSTAVLGVLALTGEQGALLETVADILRIDLATITAVIRDLASGGALDEARDNRVRVQPEALRHSLVSELFFTGPGRLSLNTVLQAIPEPQSAIRPLVGAAHLGADVDPSVLRQLVDATTRCGDLAWYATVGDGEAKYALGRAGECIGDVAAAALGSGNAVESAIHALMAAGESDPRQRHSHPEHPMRILKDYVLLPANTLEKRHAVDRAVATWLGQDKGPEIALEAMSSALRPGVSYSETDPGLGRKVTISDGTLTVDALKDISVLWEPYIQIATRDDVRSLAPVLEVLGGWCYPSRLSGGSGASEEWLRFSRKQASSAIRALAARSQDRPGVLAALRRFKNQAGLRIAVKEDREFQVFFPEDDYEDWSAAERRWIRRIKRLAHEWSGIEPQTIAARIVRYDIEAAAADITWPRLTPQFCSILAEDTCLARELLDALVEKQASLDLLHPLLTAIVSQRSSDWQGLTASFLRDERLRPVAVDICLTHSVGKHLAREAVAACDVRFANRLKFLSRKDINSDAIPDLLTHPDVTIMRAAVIALRPPYAIEPSAKVKALWESALLQCPADDTWFSGILGGDPELLVRWLQAWNTREAEESAEYERLPDSLLPHVESLSLSSRVELLGTFKPPIFSPDLENVIHAAIADDQEAITALFMNQSLRRYHRAALTGMPNAKWFGRAEIALEAGWDSESIVAACIPSQTGWTGEESTHWQQYVSAFMPFVHDSNKRYADIAIAGVRYYGERVDHAEIEERREAVYGT